MIEAYFFTTIFTSLTDFVTGVLTALGIIMIHGVLTGFLLTAKAEEGLYTALREYLSSRSWSSWMKRVTAGSATYLPIYLFFGMMIFPFVEEYYEEPSLGLRVPGFEVIIPLELLRGFLYVLILFMMMASLKENSKISFITLSSTLFAPGALIPLLEAPLPPTVIPFHLLEILADSLLYGFALSRILSKPKINTNSLIST